MGLVGLCLAPLVLIIVDFDILVWEKCGHGLTSRPRESASEAFLDELLQLFQYPPGSSHALLGLPVESLLGGYRCLDMLLACFSADLRVVVSGGLSLLLVWNRNGLTLRSVGSNNMFPPVPF